MTNSEQLEPQMGPAVLPTVLNVGTIAEQGMVLLSLDGNPFGASLTTPHTIVKRGDRGQEKYTLHPSIDRLLVHLISARRIVNAVITGADVGNLITLNLNLPTDTKTPEFDTYSHMIDLINWLNVRNGRDEEIQQLGRQLADLADLNRADRVGFNDARTRTYTTVRRTLVAAINHALRNINQIVPGTGPS